MTRDEIYEMVRQSDLGFLLGDNWMLHHELEHFANLVAAKEREACAKECEFRIMGDNNREDFEARKCATAIRTRGEQHG